EAHRSRPVLDRKRMRRRVDERLGAHIHAPVADGHTIAVGEVARALGEHGGPAHPAGTTDELEYLDLHAIGCPERPLGRRPLRGQPGPGHGHVVGVALILMEAAHVPAVVELHHAPLVTVAAGVAILVDAEVVHGPLSVDPSDRAVDVLAGVAPAQTSPHHEATLEVGVGPRCPEKHHLAAEYLSAEPRRPPRGGPAGGVARMVTSRPRRAPGWSPPASATSQANGTSPPCPSRRFSQRQVPADAS